MTKLCLERVSKHWLPTSTIRTSRNTSFTNDEKVSFSLSGSIWTDSDFILKLEYDWLRLYQKNNNAGQWIAKLKQAGSIDWIIKAGMGEFILENEKRTLSGITIT